MQQCWSQPWELQGGCRSYSANNVSLVFRVLVCSGGFAAAVTTPLDVAKTRIMLAKVRVEESSRHARGMVIAERNPAPSNNDFSSRPLRQMQAGTIRRINEIVLISLNASPFPKELSEKGLHSRLSGSYATTPKVKHPTRNLFLCLDNGFVWCVCVWFLRTARHWIFCLKISNHRAHGGLVLPAKAEGQLLVGLIPLVSSSVASASTIPVILTDPEQS